MPTYLHKLLLLAGEGKENISTTRLAEHMNLDPIIVRKDFALTGITGRPGVGFTTDDLICAIQKFLGWDQSITAVLVGAGSLGTALLGFDEFRQYGLEFVGIFDSDPQKIGTRIRGYEVLDAAALPTALRLLKPTIGVVSVSAETAQPVADILTANGVRALWNFVNVSLKVPKDVIVQREVLAGGYAVLSAKLRQFGLMSEEMKGDRKMIDITICMGSSCFARGNEENLRIIERFIRENDCADRIHLSGKCCLGRCSGGPNIVVDGVIHSKMDRESLIDLLEELKTKLAS